MSSKKKAKKNQASNPTLSSPPAAKKKSTERSGDDDYPSANYLISCDVPTKQFIQYLNDLKGANPPTDVKDYHDQTVKALSESLEKLKKDKNPSALSSGDRPQPSQAKKDRLSKVADSNEDCKKAGFSF